MSDAPVEHLPDEMWITQVGTCRADGTFKFHSRPRPMKEPPELDVSWLMGRLEPRSAVAEAFGRGDDRFKEGKDAVRHVQIGELRKAGFRVEHTPRLGTALHVSVFCDDDWDDRWAALMDAACTGGVI